MASQKPLPPPEEDFVSACKAVAEWLFYLDKTYDIFSQLEIQQLDETGRQLREKQILISVVGHLNVGKSTLLNTLLRARLLPMKKSAETTIKVQIHHDPKATSDEQPKLLLDKVPPEEVVGVTEIYKKLETLNQGARQGAEGHEEVCTLKTNVPLLANTPSKWQVVLVDTPGAGDFNNCVAVIAEGAVKSSSAYVLTTTYGELQSAENANFIRFLRERDQGVLEDRRLIVVVTQFDRTNEPDDTEEEITVEKVQEKVRQLVSEACPNVKISRHDVLPLSGLWAYNARMLMSHPDEPEHSRYRRNVERCLLQYQCQPRDLTEQSDNELAEQLLQDSGFASFEARILNVTKSCIKIWVSKMKGDYERYLKQARDKLSRQSESELEQKMRQEEECLRVKECLGDIDNERHDLEEIMRLKFYTDLRTVYPPDQEFSETLQLGKQMVLDEIEGFKKECIMQVKDKQVTFGPPEFEKDVKAFLDKMSKGLEQISSSTGWFKHLNNVLTVRTTEMGGSIEVMKGKVEQLCANPGQKTAHQTAEKLEASGTETDSSNEPHIAPNLAAIKKTLFIPSVEPPPWWSPLIEALRDVISHILNKAASTDDNYRSWNHELKATMDQLERQLRSECDAYYSNIKEHIFKYFHDQYCFETRSRLAVFDGESKAKINDGRRQLQELNESLESTDRKIKELQQLFAHMEKLTSDLYTKAADYISSISK